MATIIPPFQAGFRLIDGSDLNKLVTDANAINPQAAYNTNGATSGTTLTGANISGGIAMTVLNMTGTISGAANAQLPTVAALVAAWQAAGIQPQVGDAYELDILNLGAGAFAWTVTTNTGWTLNGTMSINQNTGRRFVVSFQSMTAATIQSMGGFSVTAV